MAEVRFSSREADELLEFIEGEGCCMLGYEPADRLYDALSLGREPGADVVWLLSEAEAEELLEPIGDCVDTAWSGQAELLYARLRAVAAGQA